PTTQYAIATSANWWPPLNLDPRTIAHPFNTYVNTGLPPTPIANPSLKSMQAVIYSAETKYLFFRAKCDGSKTHNFSVTYEEHLGYGCK
ncbi:MAG: endolytic transglycosylase MltG, partial [Chloroflexi bacterium]|nr:endolytic transglycosylase MltG [Chloroflexota bacterium]